ncbi:MAG TPA: PfkB family carbohydrate kinase [Pyrinomonadaceae bacterium]|nr:PfkB family carbohydrate kinase [Pyrinomonadaceae bacterium]
MSNIADKIRREFARKKIVIVGDLVADQFLSGKIARISREAPVFILEHEQTETLAGGAANAAVNVAGLGASACLVGVVGKDLSGEALLESLQKSNVNCAFIAASEKVQTTTKVRVLASQHYAARQQVIRIDYENKQRLDAQLIEKLKENLLAASENADAIIISDYNYGVATAEIAALATRLAKDKKIALLVDSRYRLKDFSGGTSATPNQEEAEQILGEKFSEIARLAESCVDLRERLGYESLLVTCGNKGMLLIEKDRKPLHLEAVGSKEPVDVTGAGDTVIAAYALALASGLSFSESANLANHAGGIVVMKKGTASVSAEELLNSIGAQQGDAAVI